MVEWLKLTDERKRQILNQANAATGLPIHAIEKDWWVTLSLQAIFSTQWKDNLVFKGGTSLSKAWGLIERFSEDIDLAIDRKVLGFPEEFVSYTQVAKLRKAASAFIATTFRDGLEKVLLDIGLTSGQFQLKVKEGEAEDRDPQILELNYNSVLEPHPYIEPRVIIEIGARSLLEPSSDREIKTILSEVFPQQPYSGKPFVIQVVDPMRTFLEKAFLLQEEFLKPPEKMRHFRLSRHLYDLEKMMDTEHAAAALADYDFYASIIEHRQKFNHIRGLDYSGHSPHLINFIPPASMLSKWEGDYSAMRANMIYGKAHSFDTLLERLNELKERFRLIKLPNGTLTVVDKAAIDPLMLASLIEEAKGYPQKDNFLHDGATISIPVTRPADKYQAESEKNKSHIYTLNFKRENGELIFMSVEENNLSAYKI